MTTTAIRKRLYDYIKVADDKKIKAIYTLLEDQMTAESGWWDDNGFVAELDERVRRYETGVDAGSSIEATRPWLNKMKEEYRQSHKK